MKGKIFVESDRVLKLVVGLETYNYFVQMLVAQRISRGTESCFQQILACKPPVNGAHCSQSKYHGSLCVCVGYVSIHNITAKAALKFGSEVWVLKKREEQRLEATQMKFLRHLLGITKLDKEKNKCIRQKNGSTEHSKGNKTVPEKVATTCTEDGHKQTTKTSTTV